MINLGLEACIARLGSGVMRWSLVLFFIGFGIYKFTPDEAAGTSAEAFAASRRRTAASAVLHQELNRIVRERKHKSADRSRTWMMICCTNFGMWG